MPFLKFRVRFDKEFSLLQGFRQEINEYIEECSKTIVQIYKLAIRSTNIDMGSINHSPSLDANVKVVV